MKDESKRRIGVFRGRRAPVFPWLAAAAAVLITTLALPWRASGQETHRLAGAEVAIYNLAGTVQVLPGSGEDVVVRWTRGGRDADRLTAETGTLAGRETLRVRYPSDRIVYPEMGRGSNSSVTVRRDGTFADGGGRGGERVSLRGSGSGLEAWADLVIEVPAGRAIEVYLAVGHIGARGIRGGLRLHTGSGRVTASDVTGALHVDTGSGRVELRDVQGDVRVDTGSGEVDVSRIAGGEVELDTGSGRVEVDGVEARRLRIDTGSGAIRVSGVRSRDVGLDTGSGSVDIELLSRVDRLSVDTGSGSVTVRVPADFGAELELDTGSGRIDVQLPMEVRSASRDRVRGRIGDGAGRLTVDTGSGGIRVVPGS